jgi:hypothetical protein
MVLDVKFHSKRPWAITDAIEPLVIEGSSRCFRIIQITREH